jgi:Holliday junction resolvasome RuvABC ATP-dependent DNA helicase subunit
VRIGISLDDATIIAFFINENFRAVTSVLLEKRKSLHQNRHDINFVDDFHRTSEIKTS